MYSCSGATFGGGARGSFGVHDERSCSFPWTALKSNLKSQFIDMVDLML